MGDFVTGSPGALSANPDFTAGLLQATLGTAGIQAIVAPAFDGPQVQSYTVSLGLGVKPEKVEGMAGALALAAGASMCRVCRAEGKLVVEVPKPEGERKVLMARRLMGLKAPTAWHVPMGLGTMGQVVWLDLTDDRTAHLVLGGTTGSGKTNALHWMLFWLLSHNPVSALDLLLLDPKGGELKPFWRARHLIHPPQSEPREIVKVLAWVQAEMARRAQDGTSEPRILVVMDEVRQLVRLERRVQKYLGSITELGRWLGIHMVVTTQQPGSRSLGDALVNFPCRMLGRVATKTLEYGAAGRARSRAGDLLGRGDFLRITVDGVVRLQVPRILEEDLARLPQAKVRGELPLGEMVSLGELELAGVDPRGGWNRKRLDEGKVREAVGNGGSPTTVHQQFGINYYRAERLVDELGGNGEE